MAELGFAPMIWITIWHIFIYIRTTDNKSDTMCIISAMHYSLEQNIHFDEMQLDGVNFCHKFLYILILQHLHINNFLALQILLSSLLITKHMLYILLSLYLSLCHFLDWYNLPHLLCFSEVFWASKDQLISKLQFHWGAFFILPL